ncbi:MAG: hypothetical protein ACKV2T_41195 [Kofleriaceae bacterium]
MVAAALCGCVDAFRGSNIQVDLPPVMPRQASFGMQPAPGQIPANAHFTLWGIVEGDNGQSLFELQRFEIHPIVDLGSPCFIDVGERVPYPGIHVSQFGAQVAADTGITDLSMPPPGATEEQKIDAATAVQRMGNIAALGGPTGIKAITTATPSVYPDVAPDCTRVDGMIPPPMCNDEDSNAQRLALCTASWDDDRRLWEGTDRILTSPLNGTTFGMVNGRNPVNLAAVGGAQFFVDEDVSSIDAFAIYWRMDGDDSPGTLLLYGTPTITTRGVRHVELQSPINPSFNADMVIFPDLGEDSVSF